VAEINWCIILCAVVLVLKCPFYPHWLQIYLNSWCIRITLWNHYIYKEKNHTHHVVLKGVAIK
jgi:hypothetical protein